MISPLASVDSTAKISKNVTIQPFTYTKRDVEIGGDYVIMSNTSIPKGIYLGKGNKVHHGVILGSEPQDFHYTGEENRLIIGDNNDIHKSVVISRTAHESGCMRIGDNSYPMDGVRLRHDVQIGNHRVSGIRSTVVGDCRIDDCTILSSNVILHQNYRIGGWVLTQTDCRIAKDVSPYIIMSGNPAEYHGINAMVP